MKNLSEFLAEHLEESTIVKAEETIVEAEETIKSEKDFREAARAKFEEVFGDELDEEKMNKTIEGFLKDNAELVEEGKWGELIGMLNQSFAPDGNKNE